MPATANNAGGLSLVEGVSYGELVNVGEPNKPGAIRVIPGDPAASYLIHKLEGRAVSLASGCRALAVRS